nr:DNA gyrase subunit A [Salipiger sp. PrR003]
MDRPSGSTDNVGIGRVMESSYLNYAMSVIVSRALPDVRDGLKPVHRRILYAMIKGGFTKDRAYNKSARVVGDVMGKYHPHGDSAIYDAMVRMAQDFSMRLPLVDGQGNFGSIDGDPPAAMRYTEARMTRGAHEMTRDYDRSTVDWSPTYDNKELEPKVLPTVIPNLLINGGAGIAVGMATKLPTHNPAEAIDACLLVLRNSAANLDDVMKIMPGPDFPTGGIIRGKAGIRDAYETGRGSIVLSGVSDIEEGKSGKSRIVITELPYSVNKARFLEKIGDLANDKDRILDGITDVRDESDRDSNVRIVIDMRRDTDPHIILNKLRKHTQLVTTFAVNATCLDEYGRPKVMPLMEQIRAFVAFRKDVVRRRTIHDLTNARDALIKQIGLYAAVSLVDKVVELIKSAPDVDTARARLMALPFPVEGDFQSLLADADPDNEFHAPGDEFHLNEEQSNAILALSLRSLTGMERDKIAEKSRELSAEIRGYVRILNDRQVLISVVEQELLEARERYADPRRTQIEANELDVLNDEDLIERREVVLSFTHGGYVKRTDLDAYREQKRGGRGRSGMDMKDGDFITSVMTCSSHSPLVFFTSRGIAHSLKAWQLPEGAINARGRPMINYMQLRSTEGEYLSSVIPMPENPDEIEDLSMVFVTDFGNIRRSRAADFMSINKRGKISMPLDDENGNPKGKLVNVLLCRDDDTIMIATRKGMCSRVRVGDLRVIGSRTSTGVRGMQLAKDDQVISACLLHGNDVTDDERHAFNNGGTVVLGSEGNERTVTVSEARMAEIEAQEQILLTVSENGFAKRSSAYEYRTTNRGAKGLAAAQINKKTGPLLACFPVTSEDGLVMMTKDGQTIRIPIEGIRKASRTTQGVKLVKLEDGKTITTVAKVPAPDDEDIEIEE